MGIISNTWRICCPTTTMYCIEWHMNGSYKTSSTALRITNTLLKQLYEFILKNEYSLVVLFLNRKDTVRNVMNVLYKQDFSKCNMLKVQTTKTKKDIINVLMADN